MKKNKKTTNPQPNQKKKKKKDGFLKHMNCIKELDMHLF